MFANLKNHPFAVEAFFESSLVLTFAVPKTELQSFLPACLELDTLNNESAFIAVAMVQTKELRPKGFPKFLGTNFFLIGYRLFVRYTTNDGKKLRGLFILKSETDKKQMQWLGNIFTKYSYTTTDLNVKKEVNITAISSEKSNFNLEIITNSEDAKLPPGSPFKDWKEARKFAGPLPFTFSYDAVKKQVLIVEGVRTNWQPAPINVKSYDFEFLRSLHLKNLQLANAFEIRNVPYHWEKGRIEKWKG